jgi:hypothetical protein
MRWTVTQVVVSAAVVLTIILLTPILDLLETFFWFFVIPIALFVALGLLAEGSVTLAHQAVTGFFIGDLRKRVVKWREALSAADAAECSG